MVMALCLEKCLSCCRVDISDTLMCVYELLGPELLRKLYDKLGVLLTDMTHSRSSSWQVSVSIGLMINIRMFSTCRQS